MVGLNRHSRNLLLAARCTTSLRRRFGHFPYHNITTPIVPIAGENLTVFHLAERVLLQSVQQQLFSRTLHPRLLLLPPLTPLLHSPPLQCRCTSVEHKHWPYIQVEQLANPPQEADQVRVREGITALVPHRLEEPKDPHRGVDRKLLPTQRLHIDTASARLQQRPQTLYSHTCPRRRVTSGRPFKKSTDCSFGHSRGPESRVRGSGMFNGCMSCVY